MGAQTIIRAAQASIQGGGSASCSRRVSSAQTALIPAANANIAGRNR